MSKEDFDKKLKELLPSNWKWGYTGNLYSDGTDDRYWCLFPPAITGFGSRYYGYSTSIGSYATEDRDTLIEYVESGRAMDYFNHMINCNEWELSDKHERI